MPPQASYAVYEAEQSIKTTCLGCMVFGMTAMIAIVCGVLLVALPGGTSSECPLISNATVVQCESVPPVEDNCAAVRFGVPLDAPFEADTGSVENSATINNTAVPSYQVVYERYYTAASVAGLTQRAKGDATRHAMQCCGYATNEAPGVVNFLNARGSVPCWHDASKNAYYLTPLSVVSEGWFTTFAALTVIFSILSFLCLCLSIASAAFAPPNALRTAIS